MRLIDADAFIEENKDVIDNNIDTNRYEVTLRELIDEAPTVEERPHGEWIDEPIYKQTMDVKTWDGYTYCSECKQMHEYGYRSNFCPNCGADMRKEGDAE